MHPTTPEPPCRHTLACLSSSASSSSTSCDARALALISSSSVLSSSFTSDWNGRVKACFPSNLQGGSATRVRLCSARWSACALLVTLLLVMRHQDLLFRLVTPVLLLNVPFHGTPHPHFQSLVALLPSPAISDPY
eukprot:7272149-Pyramimonas_sp.AAC.2